MESKAKMLAWQGGRFLNMWNLRFLNGALTWCMSPRPCRRRKRAHRVHFHSSGIPQAASVPSCHAPPFSFLKLALISLLARLRLFKPAVYVLVMTAFCLFTAPPVSASSNSAFKSESYYIYVGKDFAPDQTKVAFYTNKGIFETQTSGGKADIAFPTSTNDNPSFSYPNPSRDGQVTIHCENNTAGAARFEICNNIGQEAFSGEFTADGRDYNLELSLTVASGVYFARIQSPDGIIVVKFAMVGSKKGGNSFRVYHTEQFNDSKMDSLIVSKQGEILPFTVYPTEISKKIDIQVNPAFAKVEFSCASINPTLSGNYNLIGLRGTIPFSVEGAFVQGKFNAVIPVDESMNLGKNDELVFDTLELTSADYYFYPSQFELNAAANGIKNSAPQLPFSTSVQKSFAVSGTLTDVYGEQLGKTISGTIYYTVGGAVRSLNLLSDSEGKFTVGIPISQNNAQDVLNKNAWVDSIAVVRSDDFLPSQTALLASELKDGDLGNVPFKTFTHLNLTALDLFKWKEGVPIGLVEAYFQGKNDLVKIVTGIDGKSQQLSLVSGDYDIDFTSSNIDTSLQRFEIKGREMDLKADLIPKGEFDWFFYETLFRHAAHFPEYALRKWLVQPIFFIDTTTLVSSNPDSNNYFYQEFTKILTDAIRGDMTQNIASRLYPEGFLKDCMIETGKFPPNGAKKMKDYLGNDVYFPYLVSKVEIENKPMGFAATYVDEKGEIIMGYILFTKGSNESIKNTLKFFYDIAVHELGSPLLDAGRSEFYNSVFTGAEPLPHYFLMPNDILSATYILQRPIGTYSNLRVPPGLEIPEVVFTKGPCHDIYPNYGTPFKH